MTLWGRQTVDEKQVGLGGTVLCPVCGGGYHAQLKLRECAPHTFPLSDKRQHFKWTEATGNETPVEELGARTSDHKERLWGGESLLTHRPTPRQGAC